MFLCLCGKWNGTSRRSEDGGLTPREKKSRLGTYGAETRARGSGGSCKTTKAQRVQVYQGAYNTRSDELHAGENKVGCGASSASAPVELRLDPCPCI
jgi:hypothetical protein